MSRITIEKMNKTQIHQFGIESWPIWTKEVSTFEWYYDTQEQCYLIEGEAEITAEEGTFQIKAGDFVTFEQGLKCTWNITKNIRKYYNFE